LAGASLFAFFSAYEGFGVPLIQSLAVGTPVIASDLSVFKEIAGNTITTCDPTQTKQAAALCDHILSQDNSQTREKGIEITKKFTWSKTADIIRASMQEVLAKKQ